MPLLTELLVFIRGDCYKHGGPNGPFHRSQSPITGVPGLMTRLPVANLAGRPYKHGGPNGPFYRPQSPITGVPGQVPYDAASSPQPIGAPLQTWRS